MSNNFCKGHGACNCCESLQPKSPCVSVFVFSWVCHIYVCPGSGSYSQCDTTRLYSVILESLNITTVTIGCRSQWPRCLGRRSAAACLLRVWVRIPPGAWMSVCCECCVLSKRGLCDELITHQGESYRM